MPLTFDPVLAFLWSVLAGFMMAMGAGGGGILAGVGHMLVLGITDVNMIKVVNQILEFTSRVVALPLYQRQRRLVGSLALCFGLGAPLGAIAGSWLSASHLADMASYRPLFGVLIVMVALRTLYEGWRAPSVTVPATEQGVPRTVSFGWVSVRVELAGRTIEFSPALAATGGFVVSFIGSMMGVAGGFLATPFMASVLLFPLYLVVGTSLLALVLPLIVSVLTYLALEVRVDWWLVAVEVPGIALGSVLAPLLNRRMNERTLKTFIAIILLALGVHYALAWMYAR